MVSLFTSTDSDSTPIPSRGSLGEKLNLTPYCVKSCANYDVAIWFVVGIGIGMYPRLHGTLSVPAPG